MKREFGKKLIEEYFPTVDLTHVIDTSGAYIPGHGTPTVILIGRRRYARPDSTIRAVLGVRGEPGSRLTLPKVSSGRPSFSKSISQDSESEWVSVTDLPRDHFAKHPWSLSGGGAADVSEILDRQPSRLADVISDIGMTILTLEDDVYVLRRSFSREACGSLNQCTRLVIGDEVRDLEFLPGESVLMPQELSGQRRELSESAARFLWTFRTGLGASALLRADSRATWDALV